jgi:hypothetical protein
MHAQLDEFASAMTALMAVHATFDQIGVERGPLELRLAYLRGVGLGLQRWPALGAVAAQPAVAVQPAPEAPAEPAPAEPSQPDATARGAAAAAAVLAMDSEISRVVEAAGAVVESVQPIAAEPTSRAEKALGTLADPIDWDAADIEVETGKWSDQERRAFFASLKDSGVEDPYEVVAAYCEARGKPRPSLMTADQRNGFLAGMTKSEALGRYREWTGIHGAGAIAAAKEAAKAKRAAAKATKAAG